MSSEPLNLYVIPENGDDLTEPPAYLTAALCQQDTETKDLHYVMNGNGDQVMLKIPLQLKEFDKV